MLRTKRTIICREYNIENEPIKMPVGCCVFYKIVCKKGQQIDLSSPKIIYYIAYCCDRQKKSLGQSLEIKGGIFFLLYIDEQTRVINPVLRFGDKLGAKERKPG